MRKEKTQLIKWQLLFEELFVLKNIDYSNYEKSDCGWRIKILEIFLVFLFDDDNFFLMPLYSKFLKAKKSLIESAEKWIEIQHQGIWRLKWTLLLVLSLKNKNIFHKKMEILLYILPPLFLFFRLNNFIKNK